MRRLVLAIAACAFGGTSALAQGAPHLDEALKKAPYRASWNEFLDKAKPAPDWLRHFSRTADGVTTPARSLKLSDGDYELYTLCKPHDCAANKLHVIFAKGGAKVGGALIDKGRGPRLIGDQSAEMTAALIRSFAQ